MGGLVGVGSSLLTTIRYDKHPALLLMSKGKEANVLLYSDTRCVLVSLRVANLFFLIASIINRPTSYQIPLLMFFIRKPQLILDNC